MKTAAQSILILAAFGWLAAGTPWRGDQALYAQYGERMSRGEVLYHDLWDVANPGVFWFYQSGGRLFGFDVDGIHLFEWLWITAFVLAVQRVARIDTLAVPLLVGGWYYCTGTADPSHLTKVEGLAVAPLVLSILLLNRDSKRAWLLAGVCGGVVLLFKFAFALILAAAWLPAAWRVRGRRRSGCGRWRGCSSCSSPP